MRKNEGLMSLQEAERIKDEGAAAYFLRAQQEGWTRKQAEVRRPPGQYPHLPMMDPEASRSSAAAGVHPDPVDELSPSKKQQNRDNRSSTTRPTTGPGPSKTTGSPRR